MQCVAWLATVRFGVVVGVAAKISMCLAAPKLAGQILILSHHHHTTKRHRARETLEENSMNTRISISARQSKLVLKVV